MNQQLMTRLPRITAYLLIADLASGLYEDPGHCLFELVKNGLVASMDNADSAWEPQRAKIEILLAPYPRAKDPLALIVLDHGCGLTEIALERYFSWVGTTLEQLRARELTGYTGASQKGIGRLAALALNQKCLKGDMVERAHNGYYVLSRTAREGKVRYIPVIPARVETDEGFAVDRLIDPDAVEMGSLKGVTGSFTAIVIPNPVLDLASKIEDALKWLMPREHDKLFELSVNGNRLLPPDIETEINATSVDASYRARIGKTATDQGGLWLCDSTTGFRVASCRRLGSMLPEPLGSPELVGDIFAPGLLRYQNTARSTLVRDFFRKDNPDWTRLQMFLIRDVVVPVKQLVQRDAITGEAADLFDEVTSLFNDRFGEPPRHKRQKRLASGGSGGTEGSSESIVETDEVETDAEDEEPPKPYRRQSSITVRDEQWFLYRGLSLGAYTLAEVDQSRENTIMVNLRGGYRGFPTTKEARTEHFLLQVLFAIGRAKFPNNPEAGTQFANEVRAELIAKKRAHQ